MSIDDFLKEENIQPADIIILELDNKGNKPAIVEIPIKYGGNKKVVLSPRVTQDISNGWYLSYRIIGIRVLARAGDY